MNSEWTYWYSSSATVSASKSNLKYFERRYWRDVTKEILLGRTYDTFLDKNSKFHFQVSQNMKKRSYYVCFFMFLKKVTDWRRRGGDFYFRFSNPDYKFIMFNVHNYVYNLCKFLIIHAGGRTIYLLQTWHDYTFE